MLGKPVSLLHERGVRNRHAETSVGAEASGTLGRAGHPGGAPSAVTAWPPDGSRARGSRGEGAGEPPPRDSRPAAPPGEPPPTRVPGWLSGRGRAGMRASPRASGVRASVPCPVCPAFVCRSLRASSRFQGCVTSCHVFVIVHIF